MLAADLEDRLRGQLGISASGPTARAESLRFAVHFARLLASILTEEDLTDHARSAMRTALEARTVLGPLEIDALIELALAPENRIPIVEDDLRAFGSRFGTAEAEALRLRLADEVDLQGFSTLYGEDEALLLLDSLFRVCAVDGRIDRREIARLVRSAEELGIDSALVGALFRKHDPRHAAGEITITLDRDSYVIGRSTHHDIPLPDPQVAPRHVELLRTERGWRAYDQGSLRPTLLDGQEIEDSLVEPNQRLQVGSYVLTMGEEGKTLHIRGAQGFSSLSVRGLHRHLPNGKVLLDCVDFTVFTGEVIAVVGPSGSGKTTLLDAIAGVAPADSGDVIFDGRSFRSVLLDDPAVVGVVPQDDVLHPELTVEEALWYAGRLRLPRNVSAQGVHEQVNRVLRELDLEGIRGSRIGDTMRRGISGGQRKRVNVGQELLTDNTRVLFLDEPTSGLDPQTSQDLVRKVRQLANDGRIVFLVTHDVSSAILSLVDHLLVLAPGGRLAWFGPPDEAAAWFGVQRPDELFATLGERSPEEWSQAFRASAHFRKYVRTREHLLGLDDLQIEPGPPLSPMRAQDRIPQLATVTRRYLRTKLRDVSGLAVLLAQAPVLGLLMWLVFPAPDPASMFVLTLSCLWFGSSASVRELIADRAIWKREARIGLSAVSYLFSKVFVLSGFVALQCVGLAAMMYYLLPLNGDYGFSLPHLSFVCALTGWAGMGIGLVIGSRSESSEAAVGSLPLVLIPQIVFGGLLVHVSEMGRAVWISYLTVMRYAFEAALKTGECLTEPTTSTVNPRIDRCMPAIFRNLGMNPEASANEFGLPEPVLYAVLGGFIGALLLLALFHVWRTAHRR